MKEIKEIIKTLEGLKLVMDNIYIGVEKFRLNTPKEIRPMPYGMADLCQYLYGRLYDEETEKYTKISIPKDICTDTSFLWDAAMKNTKDESGYLVFGPAMYAVTNHKTNGAAAILAPGILEEIAKKIHTRRFVVLPSSIHEFILHPVNSQPSKEKMEEFHEMVRTVNAQEVAPEEQLSDHAYYIVI